jgi:hypothetical protein
MRFFGRVERVNPAFFLRCWIQQPQGNELAMKTLRDIFEQQWKSVFLPRNWFSRLY